MMKVKKYKEYFCLQKKTFLDNNFWLFKTVNINFHICLYQRKYSKRCYDKKL